MTRRPRDLLLLDGFGAGATALSTYLLFGSGRFDAGLPILLLLAMSAAASGFAVFDLSVWSLRVRPVTPLRIIAGLNALYCGVTMSAMIAYGPRLTTIGALYFGVEIPIVLALAWWEWRIASRADLAPSPTNDDRTAV